MKDKKELIVMEDSPEVAKLITVTVWISRDGIFYGNDEKLARYAGATHRKCEKCGEVHEIRSWCKNCHRIRENEKFNSMPKQQWDGVQPLAIFNSDIYFFSSEELYEYCYENEVKPSELRLCICEPNMPQEVQSDYWQDDLAEDGEIPSELEVALEKLNEVIRKSQPLSWSQGKVAAIVEDEV
jgi:hypothetical protein